MSVDLRSNTMFARISLLLMDEALIKLEHGRTKDRLRRYNYDRIESVVFSRQVPWVRLITCLVVLMVPGGILLAIGQTASTISGLSLVAVSVLLATWYLYCRKTTIRIVRGGQKFELTGIFRPARLRRFRDRFIARITDVQSRDQVAISMAVPQSPVPPPPVESFPNPAAESPGQPPSLPGEFIQDVTPASADLSNPL